LGSWCQFSIHAWTVCSSAATLFWHYGAGVGRSGSPTSVTPVDPGSPHRIDRTSESALECTRRLWDSPNLLDLESAIGINVDARFGQRRSARSLFASSIAACRVRSVAAPQFAVWTDSMVERARPRLAHPKGQRIVPQHIQHGTHIGYPCPNTGQGVIWSPPARS